MLPPEQNKLPLLISAKGLSTKFQLNLNKKNNITVKNKFYALNQAPTQNYIISPFNLNSEHEEKAPIY